MGRCSRTLRSRQRRLRRPSGPRMRRSGPKSRLKLDPLSKQWPPTRSREPSARSHLLPHLTPFRRDARVSLGRGAFRSDAVFAYPDNGSLISPEKKKKKKKKVLGFNPTV